MRLSKYCDLFDIDSVLGYLNRSAWSPGTRNITIMAYKDYLRMHGLPVPHIKFYRETPRFPFIPLSQELDVLIAGMRPRRACFLKLLKDTGMRPIEAWRTRWIDVDIQQKTVNIAATKNGNPRRLRVSEQWLNMVGQMPRKNNYIFSPSGDPELFSRELESCTRNFTKARTRLANKTQNPRLRQISLYTFRHWKATTEYLRVRDIFHVKELLGHKQIDTTLRYIHIANSVAVEDQAYTCKAAKTETEAKLLIESGFDYVTTLQDGLLLFRKRK